jgi:putative methionine-R-sulfoxide reductase with GAF domain
MLYTEADTHPGCGGSARPIGETTIDATERDGSARARSTLTTTTTGIGPDIAEWAEALVARIAQHEPTEHVAVFVPDVDRAGLRLAAQAWGAGEDTGEVIVGQWIVPLEGSVCGRVYRTGLAALCADVAMDPDYRAFPGGRTRSSLTVPVGPPGGVVAVINLEAPWVGAFSIRDYERMTEAAAAARPTFPRPALD